MVPHKVRSPRELARLGWASLALLWATSCGENGYNVGSGKPSVTSAGKASHAGAKGLGGDAAMGGIVGSQAGNGNGSSGIAGVRNTFGGTNSGASANAGAPGSAGRSLGVGASPIVAGSGAAPSGGGTGTYGGAGYGGAVTGIGGATMAGVGPCGLEPNPTGDRAKRKMLVRDGGVSKLALLDLGTPSRGWITPLERELASSVPGRDMQLIGACKVMVGTDLGYEEYDLRTGQKLAEVTAFPGAVSAFRLRNRNTVVVGVGTAAAPFQDSVGIVLVELSATAAVVKKSVYPGTFARLVRPTPSGTFLIANNTRILEGDASDLILPVTFDASKVTNCASANPHMWKALRIPTAAAGVAETVVATGYCASLAIFREDGTLRTRITGGTAAIAGGATAVNPYFFSDFQRLSNGNFLVANWAGGGSDNFTRVIPILEYTPAGALAWHWGDPTYKDVLSAIQGVILLDGLDPTKPHVEDTNGQQVPVD